MGCCVCSKVRMHFPGASGQPEACCEGCLSVPAMCVCLKLVCQVLLSQARLRMHVLPLRSHCATKVSCQCQRLPILHLVQGEGS